MMDQDKKADNTGWNWPGVTALFIICLTIVSIVQIIKG